MATGRPSSSASLTAARRTQELAAIIGGDRIDVLVVGGGITGAGAALDATTRGLRTALIESHDLAFGTSRWSSKLVHGGLRYLASGDIALAYECAVERAHLLRRIAPHLVRSEFMLLPLLPDVSRKSAILSNAGLWAADALRRVAGTPSSVLSRPRRLSASQALRIAPGLPGMRGGLEFHDGQLTDDARLVVNVARTAAAHGASILTHVRATTIGAAGVSVIDDLTGESGTIKATTVINATGVWAANLAPELRLRPSRGTHVVIDAAALPGLRTNLMLPISGAHNRYLLVLRQLDGRLYVGLTDEPVDRIEDVPQPPQSEIDQLTTLLGAALGRLVEPRHILGAYAGLRPMLSDNRSGPTSDLSRKHHVIPGEHGAVHIVGGKLTTYRRMAQDVVDVAVARAALTAGPCRTANLPLVGAGSPAQLAALRLPVSLINRYGTEAAVVDGIGRTNPALATPIAPGIPVTHAELHFSVRHEGAFTAADLVDRRFRLGLVPSDREAALPAAEAAIAATADGS